MEQCRLRFPDETADVPEDDGLAFPCHVLRGGGQRPTPLLGGHPGSGHRVACFHLTSEASVVLVVLLGEPSSDHVQFCHLHPLSCEDVGLEFLFVLPFVPVTLLVSHQRLVRVCALRAEVDEFVCLVDVAQRGHLLLRFEPLPVGHSLDVAAHGEPLDMLNGMLYLMQQGFGDIHRVEIVGVEDMQFVVADGDQPCLGVVCRPSQPFLVVDDRHVCHFGVGFEEGSLRHEVA